jgi:hypothetical protein
MHHHRKDDIGRDTLMASVHLSERREARYPISFDIEVSGVTRGGQPFHEKTATINVSEWGCGFLSAVELSPNDIISVRRLLNEHDAPAGSQRQAFFQVVRVERQADHWLIGAWKADGEDVWGTELDKLAKPDESSLASRQHDGKRQTRGPLKKDL